MYDWISTSKSNNIILNLMLMLMSMLLTYQVWCVLDINFTLAFISANKSKFSFEKTDWHIRKTTQKRFWKSVVVLIRSFLDKSLFDDN